MKLASAVASSESEEAKPFTYQPDRRAPLRFTGLSLLFVYVFQYPLSQLVPRPLETEQLIVKSYDYSDWLVAYGFVIVSVVLFVSTMYGGMSGRPIAIAPVFAPQWKSAKPVAFSVFLLMFGLFFGWSYLMLKLHVGMTIYMDFDPLPFKITGFLFYGRLLIQPLILAYVADGYANSRLKWIVFAMLAVLGAWAALTSGSRFVSIMFAAPFLLLLHGKRRYVVFALVALSFIAVANAARALYLPYELGDKYIAIYANASDEARASTTEDASLLAIGYVITRPMGMGEVLMTLDYGNIASNIQDSVRTFLSCFLPYVARGNTASVKNIYGLPDDAFGGYGLDIFSNFWVGLGGSPVLYGLGVALIGWMLGRTYRLFAIGLNRFGFDRGTTLIFVALFILVFEGRVMLSPWLLLCGWLFSREDTARLVSSMFRNPHAV